MPGAPEGNEGGEILKRVLAAAVLTAVAVVTTLLYGYGDAMQYAGAGNLDTVLIPFFGMPGYYAFEVLMPIASAVSALALGIWVAVLEVRR